MKEKLQPTYIEFNKVSREPTIFYEYRSNKCMKSKLYSQRITVVKPIKIPSFV